MRVDRHGQSAFTLAGEATTAFVGPRGGMSAAAARGVIVAPPTTAG